MHNISGCLGTAYDPTTSDRFKSVASWKVLDVTPLRDHYFVLLAAQAFANCNVQGQCGADADVTMIWLRLTADLQVERKSAFVVHECRTFRAPVDEDNDWWDKLKMSGDLLTIRFIKELQSPDVEWLLRYDRKHPDAGIVISKK